MYKKKKEESLKNNPSERMEKQNKLNEWKDIKSNAPILVVPYEKT